MHAVIQRELQLPAAEHAVLHTLSHSLGCSVLGLCDLCLQHYCCRVLLLPWWWLCFALHRVTHRVSCSGRCWLLATAAKAALPTIPLLERGCASEHRPHAPGWAERGGVSGAAMKQLLFCPAAPPQESRPLTCWGFCSPTYGISPSMASRPTFLRMIGIVTALSITVVSACRWASVRFWWGVSSSICAVLFPSSGALMALLCCWLLLGWRSVLMRTPSK